MRILLLTHSFNSLTQRVFVELQRCGHTLSVEFDINDSVTREAVALFRPEVIVAPFLKRAIPEEVWRAVPCLVVHPGPEGDRGPTALDWAVHDGVPQWGTTVLQAVAEMDAGPVWHSTRFPLRAGTSKGSLYRHEVTDAAVAGVCAAVDALAAGRSLARPADPHQHGVGADGWRPALRQSDRAIDWQHDDTATVLRKIQSADGMPGLRDSGPASLETNASTDIALFLFDAHPEPHLRGTAGRFLAHQHGALCRATVDGAVWIGHLRAVPSTPQDHTLKLPATQVLPALATALPPYAPQGGPETTGGYRDLWYEECCGVGYLHFPFYNGAMSTSQCRRLTAAVEAAKARPVSVLALMGGPDFWSNGIHLNSIEAAASPADESWANIQAMDDLTLAILSAERQIVLAALAGNAGAGGVFLALAADQVLAREGVILNPHYKSMGNLYGSEYWTYLLPRRLDGAQAETLMANRLPIGATEAQHLGLLDMVFSTSRAQFPAAIAAYAAALARDPALPAQLADKARRRAADEAAKPLALYRGEELERMALNFYGFDPSYHVARYNFVFKVPKSRTPLYLAPHRRG